MCLVKTCHSLSTKLILFLNPIQWKCYWKDDNDRAWTTKELIHCIVRGQFLIPLQIDSVLLEMKIISCKTICISFSQFVGPFVFMKDYKKVCCIEQAQHFFNNECYYRWVKQPPDNLVASFSINLFLGDIILRIYEKIGCFPESNK